jgi:2-polyprenyl-6-methoxyphenol hydroxylase-like FAD-dependent oxidoreductase
MMKTNVLIIGAGPTGLMAACQLKRLGISFLIIDQKEGPTHESRALVVHARSLEIYEQMGLAGDAVRYGEVLNKVQLIINGKKVRELALGTIGEGLSNYPYLLVLEQSKNEQLLYDYLKDESNDVLWQTEMLSLKQDQWKCNVEVRDREKSFSIETDWVIAADGGKSSARHYLNIPFEGSTYQHIFYVADTGLQWPWGHASLSLCISKESFLGLFPMQGQDRYRAIGILPPEYQENFPDNFEQIVPFVQDKAKVTFQVHDTNWFSVYKVHHRCIRHFRMDRVFFAGDAAHIHSPVGGQGMNTGLQDAYNLAWKLSYVIKGFAGNRLLDSYQEERLPFAKQLVATTDRAFTIVTSGKWYNRLLRLYLFPFATRFIFRFRFMRKNIFRTISQIGIRYINSSLTVNRTGEPIKIKSGERFPYLKTDEGKLIYELMQGAAFHALVFSRKEDLFEKLNLLRSEFRFLNIIDMGQEKNATEILGIKKDVVILVRPDHYTGLITDEGIKVVRDYLTKITS